MRFALIGIGVVLLLAACGRGSNATDWDASWRDEKGRVVDERVVSSFRGPEHCDWESAVFLNVGWPLGTRSKSADDARQYVRDPDGLFSAYTAGAFEPDTSLPKGATDTRYHLQGHALWVAQDAAKAVYLVRGKAVERWPRAKKPIACA